MEVLSYLTPGEGSVDFGQALSLHCDKTSDVSVRLLGVSPCWILCPRRACLELSRLDSHSEVLPFSTPRDKGTAGTPSHLLMELKTPLPWRGLMCAPGMT